MKRLALILVALALTAGCEAERKEETTSVGDSQIVARTDARRARLERLSRVDALARLYVGHEMKRDELLVLGSKTESDVVTALAARADFAERFTARMAEHRASMGGAPSSIVADPEDLLVKAFDGDAKAADAFARWLVQSQAPAVAGVIIEKNGATFAQMTYRELLDVIRMASAGKARS